jgi:hypothetical protein
MGLLGVVRFELTDFQQSKFVFEVLDMYIRGW